MSAQLNFIGRIRTPYRQREDCPAFVDPQGPRCEIVLDAGWREGLRGLTAGQKLLVLYWFDDVARDRPVQVPRRGGPPRGVFALRSPHRPNPIAAGEVTAEYIARDGRVGVRGMDCLDGTPLLDIKPAT
ncbi:MAG: SAM-dependent methyltransferase [Xanthomonadales bacterium]